MLACAVGVDHEDAVVAGARRVWGVKAFGTEDQMFAVRRPVGVEVGTAAAVGDLPPLTGSGVDHPDVAIGGPVGEPAGEVGHPRRGGQLRDAHRGGRCLGRRRWRRRTYTAAPAAAEQTARNKQSEDRQKRATDFGRFEHHSLVHRPHSRGSTQRPLSLRSRRAPAHRYAPDSGSAWPSLTESPS